MSETLAAASVPMGHAARGWHALSVVACTAVAYLIAGRLALFLAIPPGYATPFWPAAAIALLAMLKFEKLPAFLGIWLGSIVVNATNLWPDALSWSAMGNHLLIPTQIGLGAALEAAVGAALIRRYVGYPNDLAELGTILRFLILGGPVACLVSPTLAVPILVGQGVVPASNAAFNWATWWAGDALGVLTFSVVLLPLLEREQAIWRRRWPLVPVVVLAAAAILVGLFLVFSAKEVDLQRERFRQRAIDVQLHLQATMNEQMAALQGMAGLFASREGISRETFQRYAGALYRHYPGFQGVGWAPIVPGDERQAFEARIGQGFRIWEVDAAGQRVPVRPRERYAPVAYAEPLPTNAAAVGFDLLSDERRHQAVDQALQTGKAAVTQSIQLVTDAEPAVAVGIYLPILPAAEEPQRGSHIVVGVLRVADWAEFALTGYAEEGLALNIGLDPTGEELLFRSGRQVPDSLFHEALPLQVATQTWWLLADADQDFIARARSYVPWSLLAGGLVLTTLLGVLLLTISGDTFRAERAGQRLRDMLEELNATQAELIETKRLLSLGTMVSGLAHELNTPLGISLTAASSLEPEIRRVHQRLDSDELTRPQLEEALQRLSDTAKITQRNIERSAELVKTFKSVVTDRSVHDVRAVDLAELIRETVQHLQTIYAEDSSVTLRLELSPCRIETVPGSIVQLITNLYNNCRVHAFATRGGEITIGLQPAIGGGAQIEFADNGSGIEPELLSKIFEPFFTTKRGQGGTGLGLHIVHNLIRHQLGGQISVASMPGQGTRFEIRLPPRPDGGIAA